MISLLLYNLGLYRDIIREIEVYNKSKFKYAVVCTDDNGEDPECIGVYNTLDRAAKSVVVSCFGSYSEYYCGDGYIHCNICGYYRDMEYMCEKDVTYKDYIDFCQYKVCKRCYKKELEVHSCDTMFNLLKNMVKKTQFLENNCGGWKIDIVEEDKISID